MSLEQLRELIEQPLWSKQVVVWIGERASLDQLLSSGPSQQVIDILELIPEDETWPTDPEDRSDWLRRRLNDAVKGLRPTGPERVILRVRNA
jgi:hypothetical protein